MSPISQEPRLKLMEALRRAHADNALEFTTNPPRMHAV